MRTKALGNPSKTKMVSTRLTEKGTKFAKPSTTRDAKTRVLTNRCTNATDAS
jgi:hypothetical protein